MRARLSAATVPPGARMTAVPDSPPAAPGGLRQRATMLLPVVLPLMVYVLIKLGDSSRAALAVAAVLLAAVAVGSVLLVRRRTAGQPED